MSEAVKVLSRVQLPAELLARITRSARADSEGTPDVVMYLGCNVLKTPHIALLCLEVLDRIGARMLLFGCSLCATRVQPQEDMLSSLPIPGACVPYSDIGEQRSYDRPKLAPGD
jgi:hypothetical protein